MSAEQILSLIALIITLIIALSAICFGYYKSFLEENIKKRRHKYLTPAALSGNSEWQTLIEDWRSLLKMKSWTPEYSRAEEAYRLKLREFLQTDLDKSNILDVPIVALALQCTEVYIEHYHTRHGDLDFSKALDDRPHITHVMYSGNLPENIVSTVKKIRDVEDFVEDQGVDAAMNELTKIKSELHIIETHKQQPVVNP